MWAFENIDYIHEFQKVKKLWSSLCCLSYFKAIWLKLQLFFALALEEVTDTYNQKKLKEYHKVLEENQNKYANEFHTNKESLLSKYRENTSVKGLSHQEQKLIYVEYQQDLDKLQVDYNEKLQKAQETYNEQMVIECSICRTEIDCNDKSEILALPCGHEFHTDCVKKWLEEKGECPYCRRGCSISNDLNAKGKYHISVISVSTNYHQVLIRTIKHHCLT